MAQYADATPSAAGTAAAAAAAANHCRHLARSLAGRACRYGAHMADWAPALGLYAYAAQNSIVVLNTRAMTVRTQLAGHTNR